MDTPVERKSFPLPGWPRQGAAAFLLRALFGRGHEAMLASGIGYTIFF
jgi:hypothetical protein